MVEHPTRLFFVDYLRGAVISLVVLHHLAITYGGSGLWYYVEPTTDVSATGLFSLFVAFNQAWFMGLLFLLSGYFSPASFDRKGPKKFLKDRLIRLGIPSLIFYFVINPFTVLIAGQANTPAVTLTWQSYSSSFGIGLLWFVELLLTFDIIYLIWRVLSRKSTKNQGSDHPFPSYRVIGMFILILAIASYLIRIIIPFNLSVLGFPSLADLPQYASFFLIGIVAARGDWLRRMPGRMAKRIFGIAIVATFTLFLLAIAGTEDSTLGWGTLLGYGTVSSAFYALWESTFAVGTSMFVIVFFRCFYNSPGRLWKYLSQHSYTVYIIQAPVIVTVSVALLIPVQVESLLKFFLAAEITLPLVWAAAYPIRKIPYANKVL